MASAGAGEDRGRDQDANDVRQAARRPEPAEHRQQRDPDGERQPRPGRALEPQVVAVPDGEDDDGEPDERRPRRDRQPDPSPAAATTTTHAAPGRHEAGRDRLAGLATGVARRVDEVVERPDRRLEGRHRDPEPQRGHADPPPATTATAADDEPVEQGRERDGSAGQPATPAPADPGERPAPSDVDDLVEVLDQVLDQPFAPVRDLGPDPRHQRVQA